MKIKSTKFTQSALLCICFGWVAVLPVQTFAQEYQVFLKSSQAFLKYQNEVIWESDSAWVVDQAQIVDADNDSQLDLVLSLWKRGNFGTSKPFWIEENDQSFKNHMFLYSLNQKEVKPLWHSSNLGAPNCKFFFQDINNDDKNELVVAEGVYVNANFCQPKNFAIWRWNGWGFSNETRWKSQMSELLLYIFPNSAVKYLHTIQGEVWENL